MANVRPQKTTPTTMTRLPTLIVNLVVALSSVSAFAQQSPRYALAEKLADVVGLVAGFEEAKKVWLSQSREQVDQIAEPLRRIGATPDVIAEMGRLYGEYDRSVTESWDSREAAAAYINTLAENLTETEIVNAIKYYESPEGKRINEAVNTASARLNEYLDARVRPAQQLAMKKLGDALIELRQKLPQTPTQR